ncbi:MAG: hypothetical protein ABSD28_06240 [Tepidisphaeraceae bacterium]|jgi:hypothetical protein
MEVSDFRRAITNGLGRAVLWVRDHPWPPHEDAIQHVCLHNTAYDAQCEGSRAEYVNDIVRLTGEPARFVKTAARGLMEAQEYWTTCHLFHLNRLFAQAGHAGARDALYEKFKRDDAAERFIGADELVKLDGLNGLLFVLERIGGWIATHPDYWLDDLLLPQAQEDLGSQVVSTVREAAETHPNIREYLGAVEKLNKDGSQQRGPDYRNFTYLELREKILASHGNIPRGWLSGWGKRASEDSIRLAAADLLNEADDQLLIAYLRIFGLRAFPISCERLIKLATSQNSDLATASRRALRHVHSDLVRALALNLIREGGADCDAVPLLAKNYGDDDHILIESLLGRQSKEDDFHWAAHAAVNVFKANPQAPALPSLLKIYEECRCSLCRKGAVTIMLERRIIPPPILEECKYDSYECTRQIASSVT